jgi:hypothetical protein
MATRWQLKRSTKIGIIRHGLQMLSCLAALPTWVGRPCWSWPRVAVSAGD